MRYVHYASMCGAQKINCVACSDMIYDGSDACCVACVVEVCVQCAGEFHLLWPEKDWLYWDG